MLFDCVAPGRIAEHSGTAFAPQWIYAQYMLYLLSIAQCLAGLHSKKKTIQG